jgi:membrane fusion protein, multidrug efflux system
MSRHIRFARVLSVLPLVLVACSSTPGSDPAAGGGRGGRGGRGAGGPVPVVTTTVQQKAMAVTLPAVGTVEAITTVQIRAQVTGQLSAIHFGEGQEVQKGQRLFTLDARPFQSALLQAQAVLARDTATWQNAQATQARGENLFQRGLIPRDQYETQKASAAALAATVDADKAAVENAKLNLQYTEITAPMTGRTGVLNVHVGDLIRANDTTPLVVINQTAPVYVTFAVPGRYLPDVRHFQVQKPLSVLVAAPAVSLAGRAGSQGPQGAVQPSGALGGQPGAPTPDATPGSTPPVAAPGAPAATPLGPATRGVVTFIDNAVDPTTGTIRLKGTFPNENRELWPGAFVQVTLQLTTDPDAIVVPATAVQTSQDGQFVYVVKADQTAEMRPVQPERQQGDQMIIARGLSVGETVVTDGQLRLVPGARVMERDQAGGSGARGGAGGGRGAGRGAAAPGGQGR